MDLSASDSRGQIRYLITVPYRTEIYGTHTSILLRVRVPYYLYELTSTAVPYSTSNPYRIDVLKYKVLLRYLRTVH